MNGQSDSNKISVVIPIYNTEKYIEECIISVLNQTFDNIEVIAINDGSNDNSIKVLYELQRDYNDLIIIDRDNGGLGSARNEGLKVATGKYVYFIDSDDYIDPETLQCCYVYLEENQLDMVVFEGDIFGDINGRNPDLYHYSKRGKYDRAPMLGYDFIESNYRYIQLLNIPMIVFRRDFLVSNNLLFIEGILHEDVEFYYRLMLFNPYMQLLENKFYHRRYRDNSIMTSDYDRRNADDLLKIYGFISDYDSKDLKKIYNWAVIKGLNSLVSNCINNKVVDAEDIYQGILTIYNHIFSYQIDVQNALYLYIGYRHLATLGIECNIPYEVSNSVASLMKHLSDVLGIHNSITIGIYGTGKFSNDFMDVFYEYIDTSQIRIVYINSTVRTDEEFFRGEMVHNVSEVLEKLDVILVLTELYENDILSTLDCMNIGIESYGLFCDICCFE